MSCTVKSFAEREVCVESLYVSKEGREAPRGLLPTLTYGTRYCLTCLLPSTTSLILNMHMVAHHYILYIVDNMLKLLSTASAITGTVVITFN